MIDCHLRSPNRNITYEIIPKTINVKNLHTRFLYKTTYELEIKLNSYLDTFKKDKYK